jgi:hypothetical protein
VNPEAVQTATRKAVVSESMRCFEANAASQNEVKKLVTSKTVKRMMPDLIRRPE